MRALRKLVASVSAEGGTPGGKRQHAVLDLAILADQHDQRALRLQPHELDMLEPRVGLGGQHHRRRRGSGRTAASGFAKRRLDRLRAADGGELALDRLPLGLGEVADLHQGVDEEAQAAARSAAGRRTYAAHRSGRAARDRP